MAKPNERKFKRKLLSTNQGQDDVIPHKKARLATNQKRALNKNKARIQNQNSLNKMTAA